MVTFARKSPAELHLRVASQSRSRTGKFPSERQCREPATQFGDTMSQNRAIVVRQRRGNEAVHVDLISASLPRRLRPKVLDCACPLALLSAVRQGNDVKIHCALSLTAIHTSRDGAYAQNPAR